MAQQQEQYGIDNRAEIKARGVLDLPEKKEEEKPNKKSTDDETIGPVEYRPVNETDFHVDEAVEKIRGGEKTEEQRDQDVVNGSATHPEEIKNLMEKMKEKLPGAHKKTNEDRGLTDSPAEADLHEEESVEKKGLTEKIQEKLPGKHKNGAAEKLE